jgi:hypothetical protein
MTPPTIFCSRERRNRASAIDSSSLLILRRSFAGVSPSARPRTASSSTTDPSPRSICDRGAIEMADLLLHDGFEDGSSERWSGSTES